MAKKHRNLFEKIVDMDNLRDAYRKTVNGGKRYSHGHLLFKENLEFNLYTIRQELISGTYEHGDYYQFTLFDPKERVISCLPFRDRLVQHAIHNVIEPIFESGFYSCSYACRKNKGTHKAVMDLQSDIRRLAKNGNVFYLKTDFSKYFSSIDLSILHKEISRKLSDKRTLNLIKCFVKDTGKGLVIGSLLSQLFANVYGNMFDKFIKTRLKARHYYRYMDDAVVLSSDRMLLVKYQKIMKRFSGIYLRLRFSKWNIGSLSRPVNFVGYRISDKYKLIRKDSVLRARRKINRYKKTGNTKKLSLFLSSWKGHVKWADSKNLMNHIEKEVLYAK
jgi:retron-type reverse transcriptase